MSETKYKLVATVLPSDPYDERDGMWLSLKDRKALNDLPAGTEIFVKDTEATAFRPYDEEKCTWPNATPSEDWKNAGTTAACPECLGRDRVSFNCINQWHSRINACPCCASEERGIRKKVENLLALYTCTDKWHDEITRPAQKGNEMNLDRWVHVSGNIHIGGCYYQCSVCGISDFMADTGMMEYLKCKCNDPTYYNTSLNAALENSRGIYNKFDVRRTDGSSEHGGKHHDCEYFVLDITHDPFAIPALSAYADSCEHDYPHLAHDLRKITRPAQHGQDVAAAPFHEGHAAGAAQGEGDTPDSNDQRKAPQ